MNQPWDAIPTFHLAVWIKVLPATPSERVYTARSDEGRAKEKKV